MTESQHIIDIQNINIFQNENLILKDVILKIKKGEFVYLVGKTGSGKSSLLKSLYGELKIKEGAATVLDQNMIKIKKRKLLALRRKLGVIFQDFQLLMDRSVEDNLKFVMKATNWKGKQTADMKSKI